METKTTRDIVDGNTADECDGTADYKKRWVAFDELMKEIDDMIDSVELAGYDNPIDESYHNALLNVKNAISSDATVRG